MKPLLLLVVCLLLALLAASLPAASAASSTWRRLLNSDHAQVAEAAAAELEATSSEASVNDVEAAAAPGPGPQPSFDRDSSKSSQCSSGSQSSDSSGSIAMAATFTVPIDTDLVRATMLIENVEYAQEFDPRGQTSRAFTTAIDEETDAAVAEAEAAPEAEAPPSPTAVPPAPAAVAVPAVESVEAAGLPSMWPAQPAVYTRWPHPKPDSSVLRYPSAKKLAELHRRAEEASVRDLGRLMDYLKQRAYRDQVTRIRSDGLRVEPLLDYGCRDDKGQHDAQRCDYSRPVTVGYRSSVRVTFDVQLDSARYVVVGAMEPANGGARVESLVDVASESKRDEAELRAIREAIRKVIKKIRVVIEILEQELRRQGVEVELKSVTCEVKADPQPHPWYSLANSGAAMLADKNGGSSDSAQSMVPAQMSGSTVDLVVECKIKLRIVGGNKKN